MEHYCSPSSHGDSYGVLQRCLGDILSFIKPSDYDERMRVNALLELESVVRSMESLKDVEVTVRPFGSFLSHLYTKWGDLDASVELTHRSSISTGRQRTMNMLLDIMRENVEVFGSFLSHLSTKWGDLDASVLDHHLSISTGRQRKINVLQDILGELRWKGVACNFNFIPSTRVPLLRYESKHQNVSCDVTIDNHQGWMKSRVLFLISEINEQFRDLVLLIKEWAKAHDINDPKSGTLNSYSLCLLVIFHFQTCEPAILPPLKDIYGQNFLDLAGSRCSLEREIEDACIANIAKFMASRERRGNNLAELLITFFDKFSRIKKFSKDYAICTYTGRWESLRSNSRWLEKSHYLLIEDPFDRPDNAARAVGWLQMRLISEAFKITSQELSKNSVLSDRNALLVNLVGPDISLRLKDGSQSGNCETVPFGFIGHITYLPSMPHKRYHGVGIDDEQSHASP